MKFGNPESAKELPAWLLKIKENDNLQGDNLPQFTFKPLIVPDKNVDSVFIAHDVNVRINKLLKELLDDVKNDDNNQENAEKFIDTKKIREVFVNIYCVIRKYAQHNLKIRIEKEIINSIVEKTKKEDLMYLATCFNNFSSFSSFDQLTQNKFAEAGEKCLDLMDFNSNEFLQRLESDENFARKIFMSEKIQNLSVNSLILKINKLKSYLGCLVYLSNQQIDALAEQENGLKIIKHCLGKLSGVYYYNEDQQLYAINWRDPSEIYKDFLTLDCVQQKLSVINSPQVKKMFIAAFINRSLVRLTNPDTHQSGQDITEIFDSIYVLMQNHAGTNDLNIEINYFALDALTKKIPTANRQIYSQQLQRIIELPGWGAKTLYYLKQAINFLSFGHFCNENSLMAKVRNMRKRNINSQGPVPQTENDNLNIQQ